MKLEYRVVDVFTQTPLEGNPLAVFRDGRGLDARTMQRIARELNLSETTFVLPPRTQGGAAKVRIFTPTRELRFAGHPTIGTAYVLRSLGVVPPTARRLILEEDVGPVVVRLDEDDDELLWLTTPPINRGPEVDAAVCADVLGLTVDDVIAGVPPRTYGAVDANLFVPVVSMEAVDRCALDASAFARLAAAFPAAPTCAFVFTPTPFGAYSRMFAPILGIVEDPATGSATGPLAAYMLDYGLAPRGAESRFVSEQGTKMGRRSLLHVAVGANGGDASIEVGGHVVPIVDACMELR